MVAGSELTRPGDMQSEGGDASSGQPPPLPVLTVAVFSKDRPFQVMNALASLLQHVTGVVLQVYVLFRATTAQFADSYKFVQALFGSGCSDGEVPAAQESSGCRNNWRVEWLEETDANKLGSLLEKVIAAAEEAASSSAILFTVDDAFWFADFAADIALKLLLDREDVYAVHAKLSPRNEFAHPNSKLMRVPGLRMYASGRGQESEQPGALPPLLLFDRSQGEYDWNYPWELSASLYRSTDVKEMLSTLRNSFGEHALNHPNRLEGQGVRLIKQMKVDAASRRPLCACSSTPVMAVVTINRVQSLFDNPVYGQRVSGDGASADEAEASPEVLDVLLRSSLCQVDAESAQQGIALTSCPDVCEVLAKRTGLPNEWIVGYLAEAESLELSMEEVVMPLRALVPSALACSLAVPPQPLLATKPYRLQYFDTVHVPLVRQPMLPTSDNPSGGILVSWLMPVWNLPRAWLEEALLSIRRQEDMADGTWELVAVNDASDLAETVAVLGEWEKLPHVKVIHLEENQGIAAALNAGWLHCRGDYIARLDGDDVAHPSRLRHQLSYFKAHPSVGVLGGAFTTFKASESLASEQGLNNARWFRLPCHPVLVRWHMLFSCSLAHPTVTFRRAAIGASGPYPLNEEAEDHCCWLALPLSVHMANVGDLVTFVRRHPQSRTATAGAAIRKSSYRAVANFLARHCNFTATEDDIAVLWGATEVGTAEQAQRLTQVLAAMEELFLSFWSTAAKQPPPALLGGEKELDFKADFLDGRESSIQEYVTSSCSKLRGAAAIQSLAAGDLASGAEMMRSFLTSAATTGAGNGENGLKSLAALISAGFPTQQLR